MPTAVLLSGGLDSAVLLADEAARGEVQPIYVSVGLAWEAAERAIVVALARRARRSAAASRRWSRCRVDMRDVYAADALGDRRDGRPATTRRTRTSICQAATSCCSARRPSSARRRGIDRLVIGTLAHNPFPDATPEFRAAMARRCRSASTARSDRRAVRRASSKAEVIRRGAALGVPFELTLSCMNPVAAARRPLRPVQQVPRASRRLSRSRRRRSDRLC